MSKNKAIDIIKEASATYFEQSDELGRRELEEAIEYLEDCDYIDLSVTTQRT